jgi:hypothetical protein
MLSLDSRLTAKVRWRFLQRFLLTHKPAYPSKTFEDGLDFHLQNLRTSFVIRRMLQVPDLENTPTLNKRRRSFLNLTILELVLISLEFFSLVLPITDAGIR